MEPNVEFGHPTWSSPTSKQSFSEEKFMEKDGFRLLVFKGMGEHKIALPVEATCLSCKQEWLASGTHGARDFECPHCGEFKGAINSSHGPGENDEGFRCQCTSEDFFIMRAKNHKSGAVYCRQCGVEATGWF
jgi:predicted RNA-binding Zn-ribbon protein involved in translation (DUF1610 family)